MSLFTINRDKCKRDGICVAECPMGLIEMTGKDAFPSPVEGAGELCVNCGHCVVVCPQGALSLKTTKPEDCFPVQKDLLPGPEQAEHFLSARRSIRTYKKQPVEHDTLSKLIDIACYAPSGHNMQPVQWLVIEDSGEVKRLAGLVVDWMRFMIQEKPEMARPMHMDRIVASWEIGEDRICRSAPHVIVAHSPGTLAIAQSSCTIALTYLELAAFSMGLGACWAGYFNAAANLYPPMTRALGLPEGHQSFGSMMIGYPRYHYHRIPLRNKSVVNWR